MKKILLLFLIGLSFNTFADMQTVRLLFAQASVSEASNQKLVELTKTASISQNPVLYAYNAAAEMTMANHVYWPGSKLSYFNEGKKKLENVLNKNKSNVEIRFIRYSIQNGAPFFLDYSSNLEEDKKFILDNLNNTDWPADYKAKVKEFLNNN
jgi:hypothetical protein